MFECLKLHEVLVLNGAVQILFSVDPFFHYDVRHEFYSVRAIEFHLVALPREVEPVLLKFSIWLNYLPEIVQSVDIKPFLEVIFNKVVCSFVLILFFLLDCRKLPF